MPYPTCEQHYVPGFRLCISKVGQPSAALDKEYSSTLQSKLEDETLAMS